MEIIITLLGIIFFGLVFLVFINRKSKICPQFIQKIQSHLQKIKSFDEKTKILEYDKILDICLKERKVGGKTLGERMKKYGKFFQDENEIWQAHKIRNKLAHEIDFHLSKKQFEMAEKAFLKEIENLLK